MIRWPVRILGVGVHAPSRLVCSEEIDAKLGRPPGWSLRTSGVATRRFADPAAGETASAMAESAARQALAVAGLEAADLSAVIGACGVMEQPIPGTSVLLHRRLGLNASGIAAFDVNATCLSFLPALQIAALQIAAGIRDRVLIAVADLASAALPERDEKVSPLFGDGAAAIILGRAQPDETSELLAWHMETFSDGADAAWLGAGGSRLPASNLQALLAEAEFRMDGPAAYRVAARHMPAVLEKLLTDAGMTLDQMDWIVPHQASGQALELMTRRLKLPAERMINTLETCGNQVAASLPTALAVAVQDGRIRRGAHVLLIGGGAGVSVGGAILRY